ncbi:MAG TPA: hypothetical protein VGI55_09100 [Solirubrobacteraceae bacterium]
MTDNSPRPTPAGQIPPDDPARGLAAASPDLDQSLERLGVVDDTYAILLSGCDTAGRYTLIDMQVPPAGGPPPHRHDFEEMFSILHAEVELTFRGLFVMPGPMASSPVVRETLDVLRVWWSNS